MRTLILLFVAALLGTFGMGRLYAQANGSAAPDNYGYTWLTSDTVAPGAPAFRWKSIAGAPGAHQITDLDDDNSVGPFDFGWDFHYYWTDVNQFYVGSNGWVGFNAGSILSSCFPRIPSPGGADNFVAPFMSDLNFSAFGGSPAEAWWWSNNNDTLILEYRDVPWWDESNNWIGANTFQVIFSGIDSSITFMYLDTDVANWPSHSGCNVDLVIGIENIAGNDGMEVRSDVVPNDSFAIKFFYPDTVTIQVTDAAPEWNSNAENGGIFVLACQDTLRLSTKVGNLGNVDITSNITVKGTVLPVSGASSIWSENKAIVGGLPEGSDSLVTFDTPVNFGTVGQHYSYQVITSTLNDMNPANDTNAIELVTVGCASDTANLTYSTGIYADGISWPGSGSGAGIYIKPPTYPATIMGLDIVIPNLISSVEGVHSEFFLKIYDDNGFPGTLLDSVRVEANSLMEGIWQRIPLKGAARITSGGWYIGWISGGDDLALATELDAPISRRSFEILDGSWGQYREGDRKDLQISAHVQFETVAIDDRVSSTMKTLNLNVAPNPTDAVTSIRYELPAITDVNLQVVNLYGQVVFTHSKVRATAGKHGVDFNTQDLATGIYYIHLTTSTDKVTQKLMVNH
ncbi:MAG: hypothetical protein RLZZ165_502 [Bacteroidota bacterium]|jgi:hypothetical protein